MNFDSNDILKAYLEKLYERLTSRPSFKNVAFEYGSDALLLQDIFDGKILLDGETVAITICGRQFDDMQEICTHDDEEIND